MLKRRRSRTRVCTTPPLQRRQKFPLHSDLESGRVQDHHLSTAHRAPLGPSKSNQRCLKEQGHMQSRQPSQVTRAVGREVKAVGARKAKAPRLQFEALEKTFVGAKHHRRKQCCLKLFKKQTMPYFWITLKISKALSVRIQKHATSCSRSCCEVLERMIGRSLKLS